MLLYNYGNTLIYLYLDLQSEYYQLSVHFFFDPSLATDKFLLAHLYHLYLQLFRSVPLPLKLIRQAYYCYTAQRIIILSTKNLFSDFHCLNQHLLCLYAFPHLLRIPCCRV